MKIKQLEQSGLIIETDNGYRLAIDIGTKIWPGLLPRFDWQVLFTSYAYQMALDRGLLDTTLPLDQARQKFYVTDIVQKIGYVNNFYALIRQPDQEATSSPSDINK